jgi:hypothetical protein
MKSKPKAKFVKELRNRMRLWLLLSLLLCLVVVTVVAVPVLRNPQLDYDDYRYLHNVDLLGQDFFGNITKASVVENRWDHLWWIKIPERVRFFRPIVMLSYWSDVVSYGSNYKFGLLLTNVLIYSVCVSLACLVFYRWLTPGLPFLVASVLFASFASHGEVLWYVAGRTDSLAAVFVLASVALHSYGSKRKFLRSWALLAFAMAALTKEFAAVLPVLFFIYDLWIEKRFTSIRALIKSEWRLYGAYVIVAAVVFYLGMEVTSAPDKGYPYPYFTTWRHPDFLLHLWSQLRTYSANLLFGTLTVPFWTPSQIENLVGLQGVVLGICILAASMYFLREQKKYWFLLIFAVAFWLPTTFAYVSERYLLLPSFAVAGIVGLLLMRFRNWNQPVFYGALIAVLVWSGHQAYVLDRKVRLFCVVPRQCQMMERELGAARASVPRGGKVLVLNMPGDWLSAQFMKDFLRVELHDPSLEVTIITMMPFYTQDMGSNIVVRKEGEDVFSLENKLDTPIMTREDDVFPWVTLEGGDKYADQSGLQLEILKGDGSGCKALRVVVPRPLSEYVVLKWNSDPDRKTIPYVRQLRSKLEVLTRLE